MDKLEWRRSMRKVNEGRRRRRRLRRIVALLASLPLLLPPTCNPAILIVSSYRLSPRT